VSKISETTKREDKGHNRVVIDWFERRPADRPYLITTRGTVTYGQVATELAARQTSAPRVVVPALDIESVLDILAGIAGGGATVVARRSHIAPVDSTLVVYTSGTTGPAKGVRLSLDNLIAASDASARHLGHGESDTWLLAMPLHHVGGISILVRQAFCGGAVRMLPGFDEIAFAHTLKGDVTMASVVPTMLHRLLGLGPFAGLKAVLVGGGPIPAGLLESADRDGLPVLPTYGMTETFGQVATLRPGSPVERKAHLLPGIDIRIGDDGRIAVRGRQVFPGYVGEPDRTSPWFVTNDLGSLDEDGALRVLGRADHVIVTGGEKVDPAVVEVALIGHPDISEAVVYGVPDEEWGERVVASFIGEADPVELESFFASRLPIHMVPKEFRRVVKIPRTALGKPDRHALRLHDSG